MIPEQLFTKEDSNDDNIFYTSPRLVKHIDENACHVLKNYYDHLLKDGDAVLDLKHGSTDRLKAFIPHESNGAVRPIEETTSCYYLRLSVLDRPGVLAKVSAVLAKNKIGISSVIQPEGHEGSSVPLILMLHYAKNAAMQKALKEISKLSAVKAKPVMIRVENFA